ncbi:MAG: tRNA 2-thiouridine(34) synthase MnmA [Clostridia bacterium]
MKKKVVLAMSGGVDSSVAAALLVEQGYDVIGLFMRNWEEEDGGGHCTAEADYDDVKNVCNLLNIPYYTVNYAKQYKDKVFKYFLEEYAKGRTPNPDVLCNREIKFGPFLTQAYALGADYIATGHYCGIVRKNGFTYLTKAADKDKDQTYFLNQLSQTQLKDVMFPLENMVKNEVRAIAEKYGLSTAKKKDSTGICFIGERNFREFLSNYFPNHKGDIVTIDGKVVGEHIGLMYYTIGQRRGLGLGGEKENQNRWFVVEKDMTNNRLIVSHGDESVLDSKALFATEINWIPKVSEESEFECFAKFRYRQEEQKVKVKLEETGDKAYVEFDTLQRAVTEGQYVVFYNETDCLGGGVIDKVFK